MSILITIFQLIVLIFSIVVHEVSHGFVAEKLGDPTARKMGRLTLNPLKHIDPFGSILLPLALLLPSFFIKGFNGPVFGWAKPVPYNPMFLKYPRRDAALLALAGPASNLVLAVVFAGLFRLVGGSIGTLFAIIVITNISLALFNLIPIPPLDGSKMLFYLLPKNAASIERFLEQYGWYILLFFIVFGVDLLSKPILGFAQFLLGVNLF
ncbi:MAG: peptidase M50 [Parcubacteria group bacterium LiPW_41]|nr:MAG: peptidase M50 [Parcubacteria group bacterium LiPW_41]